MKNMKKFITLCGFLILGSIACGDADVVKAEAVNEQTTDTSGYTITIPSDVDIDKDSGKGSFCFWKNGCSDQIRCNGQFSKWLQAEMW